MKSEKSEGGIWITNESRFEVALFEVISKWKLLSVNDCESRSPTVTTMELTLAKIGQVYQYARRLC